KGNEDWMLIPLSERWMPPKRVIDIFEKEGFIWGGKWTVWDNMHFEYRPELILGRELVKP
ncbi:MAG TPA: M15 family metallopeptidase, partial [Rectinema sp.]|nr:M15 family metallopeptidase [Rectinema sp.]